MFNLSQSKSLKQIIDDTEKYSKYKRYCKCGHSMTIANTDRVICSFCGNYVYYNQATEFKYKMKEQLRKQKKDKK